VKLIAKTEHIIVVGGSAAGPSAAAKAKRTNPNANITLIEAGNFISVGTCELPYLFNGTIKDFNSIVFYTPETFFQEKNVMVKTNTIVKKIDRKNKQLLSYDSISGENYFLGYDKLILTTGSVINDLPELTSKPENFSKFKTIKNFIEISEYFNKKKVEKVLIVGGGFTGLEVADTLLETGIKVSIYDKNRLFSNFSEKVRSFLLNKLKDRSIEIFESQENIQYIIKENKIVSFKISGKYYETDYVIQSTGVKPNNYLAETSGIVLGKYGGIKIDNKLKSSDNSIFAAGDNIELTEFITGKPIYLPIATFAKKFGNIAGANAAGDNLYIKPIIKNITFKFKEIVFAFVGLSLKDLEEYNYNFYTISASSNNLVDVMPQSTEVNGLIYIDKRTNLILGGEFWGDKIVSNYADIISIYIKNKINAINLADEYFNYSPPVSPLSNLINILGQKFKKEK